MVISRLDIVDDDPVEPPTWLTIDGAVPVLLKNAATAFHGVFALKLPVPA